MCGAWPSAALRRSSSPAQTQPCWKRAANPAVNVWPTAPRERCRTRSRMERDAGIRSRKWRPPAPIAELAVSSIWTSATAKIIGVTSNPEAPVNGMALCVKGRYGWDFVHHPDRLKKPRVRRYLLEKAKRKAGRTRRSNAWDWIETDWDTALDITAHKAARNA